MPPTPAQDVFSQALRHHRERRLAEAENLCRQVLAAQPDHANAWHLLGIIAHQAGRHDMALEWIRRSLELNPNDSAAYCNLGEAYRLSGHLPEAISSFEHSLRLNPQSALTYYDLAIALVAANRTDEAIAAYHRALALQPDSVEVANNLGSLLRDSGRLDESITSFQQALKFHPDSPEVHNNLGIALRHQGRLASSTAAFRRAVELRPTYVQALNNLGNGLQEEGLLEEAVASYRRALDLKPDYAEASNNLGNALRRKDLIGEAAASYERAIELQPGYVEAWLHLGNACKDQGEWEKSIAAYRRSVELAPELPSARGSLLLALNYVPGLSPEALAEERAKWNAWIMGPLRSSLRPHGNDRNPDRRLRVGYVSADFCDHVVGRNLVPLFRHHDHTQCEIVCYSGTVKEDEMTKAFYRQADRWRRTVSLSDEALADMIRADEVDILVDLAQHTAGNRLGVFARQPAPVQVSFAGYPETTGLETIGFRLSDRWMEPEAAKFGNSKAERVFAPESFWCYDPCGLEVAVNESPARTAGRVTFGCFNDFCKVNEGVLACWARVLREVEGSRLMMLCTMGDHRERTLRFLEERGVSRDRIEFADTLKRQAYLERYQRLDVVLDPFPYNGHTTSLDALWMGIPMVSLIGPQAVSRAGWSQLSNLGLQELAAFSEDEYVRIAVELARDKVRLAELRATLRSRMETSVLMDGARFTRQIEGAYREMWQSWCASR